MDDQPGRGIRLAFVGAGHWHILIDARYLELARAAGAEIVGLSDDDEATARRLGELVGCSWSADPVDLVERCRPDLVVATPRPDRAPAQVGALLQLGRPLFAEKPLGLRADDVWPLAEPAERGWVTVAFPNRYLPLWQHLDRLRSEHRFGPLIHLNLRLVKGTPERYVDFGVPWMLDPAVGGGGPLRNFGIHFADLISWQLGPRAARVVGASLTHRRHDQPIEDYGVALLRTDDGVVATLETGYSHPDPGGSDLALQVAAAGAYLVQTRDGLRVELPDGTSETVPPLPGRGGYRELFFDALRRFRRGDPPIAGVRDCALANEIVDAAYDAARSASHVSRDRSDVQRET